MPTVPDLPPGFDLIQTGGNGWVSYAVRRHTADHLDYVAGIPDIPRAAAVAWAVHYGCDPTELPCEL